MIDEFALFQLVFSSQEIGDRRLFYLFSPHPTPHTPHPFGPRRETSDVRRDFGRSASSVEPRELSSSTSSLTRTLGRTLSSRPKPTPYTPHPTPSFKSDPFSSLELCDRSRLLAILYL
ncbi:hypothetical protein EZJ55_17690 [Microcystis aeruginosa EAWAG127a]|uniref:Uncharacterized protein n=1 Tax=Microcystis aeruginosa EAWAG127a TaxID=2529855 RepID=A0A5J5LX58_MICAE|nr:hypothetical protein EZJ55_17690 [Microcystis aeruginosa EAWAG127a]